MLAFETKNNKNKIAKWTAAALLAGADMIKLGFVSRVSPRDNTNHVLLATQVRSQIVLIRMACSAALSACRASGDGVLARCELFASDYAMSVLCI